MKNMRMKQVLFLLMISQGLWIVSCSNTEKKETVKSQPKPMITNEVAAKENILNMDTEDTLSSGDQPQADTNEIAKETSSLNNQVESNSQYWALYEAIKSQKDEQIKREASRILLKDPKDLKALNAFAMSSYRKGRYALARHLLNKAKQYHPNSAEIYANLGVIDLATDDKRSAMQNFKRSLELNSDDQVSAANIGSLYVREQDYTKAKVALEISYRKGMRDPKVLNNYAISLAATGKYEKANEIYEEVLRMQPSNKEVLFNSAVLLIEHLKKYNEGLDRVQKLKFIGGPAESKNKIIALENKAKAGLK